MENRQFFRVMHRYLPLALIVGLLIVFRLIGGVMPESQPNFQPLAALFFCGALLAPGWRGFPIPFGTWVITYPFAPGPVTDFPVFATTFIAFIAVYAMGTAAHKRGLPTLLVGSVFAAGVFHLITNGAAWLGDPSYEKSAHGLWQSLWTGPPGSTIPSWIFLRNFAAANLLFTAIFVSARLRLPQPTAPVADPLPAR